MRTHVNLILSNSSSLKVPNPKTNPLTGVSSQNFDIGVTATPFVSKSEEISESIYCSSNKNSGASHYYILKFGRNSSCVDQEVLLEMFSFF